MKKKMHEKRNKSSRLLFLLLHFVRSRITHTNNLNTLFFACTLFFFFVITNSILHSSHFPTTHTLQHYAFPPPFLPFPTSATSFDKIS